MSRTDGCCGSSSTPDAAAPSAVPPSLQSARVGTVMISPSSTVNVERLLTLATARPPSLVGCWTYLRTRSGNASHGTGRCSHGDLNHSADAQLPLLSLCGDIGSRS